jgi:uncharacterized cupredoxin-like copper-binding protein
MRFVFRITVGFAVVVAAVGGVVWALAGGPAAADSGSKALGPGRATVDLFVDKSHFSLSRIVVRPHTEVTFVIHNEDPILHEFIVGGPEVHAIHESGHEAQHPTKPGEVTVRPQEVGTTTYLFHEPGTVVFACHLPGHLAYGMSGEIVVEAA